MRASAHYTYNNIGKIIKEAKRIINGNKEMEAFTLDKGSDKDIARIVKKSITKRNENLVSNKRQGVTPATLDANLLERLEKLSLNSVSREVAYTAMSYTHDPVFLITKTDAEQFALVTTYINKHFPSERL